MALWLLTSPTIPSLNNSIRSGDGLSLSLCWNSFSGRYVMFPAVSCGDCSASVTNSFTGSGIAAWKIYGPMFEFSYVYLAFSY